MRVAITGSSGLIGSAVRESFAGRGWSVTRVVRSAAAGVASDAVVWHPPTGPIDGAGLEGHDVVVHTAGASVAGMWTADRKRRIERSRVQGTQLLATTLAGLDRKPALFISLSGMHYYGQRDPDEPITEEAGPGTGFLPELVGRWETAAVPAAEAGIRVVNPRLGNVLSPKGGLLATILPIFKLGLGSWFGDGRQIWPWIALDDVVGAIEHIVGHSELRGPVNTVAPQAVSNREFTRAVAGAVNRPALFGIPAFAARLAPGGMADEILLSGARVVPRKLLDSGYAFRFTDLRTALRAMLRGQGR